jgi:hypothetical protein
VTDVNKITNKAEFSAAFRADRQQDAIANQNKELAVALAKAGIPVFLCKSEDKTPLPIAWEQLDTAISPEEREARRRKYVDDKGFEPQHIGCTLDTELIRKWFRENKTALPAISCGPAGVYVVDNDKKVDDDGNLINDGVALFDAFAEPHGGLPKSVFSLRTPRGGRHVYFDGTDTASLGCRRGSLTKGKYETDLKGTGGYVLAVSAIRSTDGKSYGTKADLKAFLKAYKAKKLVPVPKFIRDAIGTKPEGAAGESNSVSERDVQALVAELRQTELPDAGALLDPALDGFDMPKIEQRYPKFREAIDAHDFSGIRYNLAGALRAERANVTAAEYAAVLFQREDCGEFVDDDRAIAGTSFNWRNVSKDFLRAVPLTTEKSTGEAFDAVEDDSEEGDAGVPSEHLRMQENIRRKAEREAETVKLKAEIAELDKTDVKPKTEAPKTEAPKTKFLRSMDIFENFTPPDELIEGLLPAVGTACIVADSNVGKTFFAIHLLDTVMRGEKFFGRNTERGGVLMVAGEGRSGLNKRLAALHEERPYPDGRGIGVSYELPEFSNEASIKVEILKLEKLILSYDASNPGEKTRIVVLDNLIAMVGGGDINTSKDTRPLFRALDDLAEKLKICIVVIHHENRGGTTAGSFAIRASTDIMLHITEDKNGVRTVSGDKDRDNSKSHKMQFRLKSVKVGVNKWGSDVTSCVVVPALSGEAMGAVEEGEEAPPLKVSDDPDDRLNRLLEAARECAEKAAAHGEPAEMVPLSPKEIGAVFNTHRERYCGLNGKPLTPLNREGVNRIIARALEAEKLVLRKAKYHLAD